MRFDSVIDWVEDYKIKLEIKNKKQGEELDRIASRQGGLGTSLLARVHSDDADDVRSFDSRVGVV